MMPDDLEQQLMLANARAERFKKARTEAEGLLEAKSRELYEANQKLQRARESLEEDIEQATYELNVTNVRLQSALDEKSAFLGQMSHEVRTPLNAIIGLSEILLDTRLSELQLDYLNTINDGAKSLIVLIDDLLDITKIEAGRVNIQPEPTNTHHMLRNIIRMFEMTAQEQGLKLGLNIDDSVPKVISIDVGRYTQIINNLISNAIKNTLEGEVLLEVFYKNTELGNGCLTSRVVDTGVGIANDKISTIFNAYEQIGNPTQGVGLGLSICRQLAGLMEGHLTCESTVGKGSVFSIELPVEKLSSESLQANTTVQQSIPSLPPLKILVAEDNPTNQKVLTAQLAQLGQVADVVNNGVEALNKLKLQSYDVVILDILMPEMDGEETLLQIRNSFDRQLSRQYCIALTASSYQNQKARLLNLGFDAFLSKPLGMQELAEALSDVMKSTNSFKNEESPYGEWETIIESIDQGGFDFTYLRSQFGDACHIIFEEIAPTFLTHAYEELEQLISYAEAGEAEKIRKTSHSIKGAASSLGLNGLANILLKIENQPDALDVASKVAEAKVLMNSIKPTIEKELKNVEQV